ncbi:sialidase family protein [Methylocystis bryophila]|uniref:Glycosyl hydrolase n=1 Tax=Methylocystis bryophila TaxID=655015 RepID=A0A1W6MZM1_9HYPH|nr:sialidase family protein [Methylocystis bryophila]ARN83003.1 glycosyl hydrolase [Methylocystis bryophila]BDV39302.1 lipoprotein [Methylocystis bryophila]
MNPADWRAAFKSTSFGALALAAMAAAVIVSHPARGESRATAVPTAAPAAKSGEGGHEGHMMGAPAAPACLDPLPRCASTAEPAFSRDGTLWLAFPVGDKIYVASSRDSGASFAPAVVAATVTGGVIDANGEARPKIAALPNGALLISYTARPEKSYDGSIWLVRSVDGGKSFSAPEPLLDSTGQRFDIFLVSPKGRIYAAWLDKRDAAAAKQAGEAFAGSGIAVGWSDDGGKSFVGKKILMDHSCECCRVSAAFDPDGQPVFAWRHVYDDNLRDHYVAKLSKDGATLSGGRVSEDEWATGCPHQGPSLAIDAAGTWHVTWFTNGKARKGLFYASSADGGKSFSAPQKLGDDAKAPSRAAILFSKGKLYRVWKEFDGTTTGILLQSSKDSGKSWSAARTVATTAETSDQPRLIDGKTGVYLSWLTKVEGYRLLPLGREDAAEAAQPALAKK